MFTILIINFNSESIGVNLSTAVPLIAPLNLIFIFECGTLPVRHLVEVPKLYGGYILN